MTPACTQCGEPMRLLFVHYSCDYCATGTSPTQGAEWPKWVDEVTWHNNTPLEEWEWHTACEDKLGREHYVGYNPHTGKGILTWHSNFDHHQPLISAPIRTDTWEDLRVMALKLGLMPPVASSPQWPPPPVKK